MPQETQIFKSVPTTVSKITPILQKVPASSEPKKTPIFQNVPASVTQEMSFLQKATSLQSDSVNLALLNQGAEDSAQRMLCNGMKNLTAQKGKILQSSWVL